MEPTQSRIVVVATLLERYLTTSVAIGIRGALFFGSWFVLYVLMGAIVDVLGWFDPPYPPLSLESDPLFVIGGAVVGLFIVQTASSFILYHLLVGVDDDKSQFAVLWGFISLGFGGALLRVTLPTAVEMLYNLL